MLGMTSHPHHEAFMPKFCKQYANVGEMISKGLEDFKADVEGEVSNRKRNGAEWSDELNKVGELRSSYHDTLATLLYFAELPRRTIFTV